MRIRHIIISILSATIVLFSLRLSAQPSSALYPSYEQRKHSPGKTNYFIDPNSGNDLNSGTDENRPWKTFTRVNHLILAAGDNIHILTAGVFHESLVLIAEGTVRRPIGIYFAPGRYELFPDKAIALQLHISNTNDSPYKLKSIAFVFDRCKYTSVYGKNAAFVMRGKMIESYINNCKFLSLNGISFDYHRPTVSELTVIAEGSNFTDLLIHKDSKYSVKDSMLIWNGDGWNHKPESYWQVLDTNTNDVARLNIRMQLLRFVNLGRNIVRAYFPQSCPFKKGYIYQSRAIERDCAGIFMQRSKNIRLESINIFFMHGMGIVSQYCNNINISRLIVRPSRTSGRTCAAWADILHFSGCKGLIDIGNSYLSAANDDAINIHGTHLKITKIIDDTRVLVRFMHEQTYGFNPFSKGDSLDFIRPRTLLPIQSNLVLDSKMLNDKEVLLILSRKIPFSIDTGDVVENTTATPKVRIHHNTFFRIPTRGVLVTTRRKIMIENNNFINTHMNAILVSDDAGYWYESGLVKDLTIRNNSFFKCGSPVIAIRPETTGKYFIHTNISIFKNKFDLKDLNLLFAQNTSRLQLFDNEIKIGITAKSIRDLIEVRDCSVSKVAGNNIQQKDQVLRKK